MALPIMTPAAPSAPTTPLPGPGPFQRRRGLVDGRFHVRVRPLRRCALPARCPAAVRLHQEGEEVSQGHINKPINRIPPLNVVTS